MLSPYHRFELVLGDLADTTALERLVRGADAIIHLGGLVKALRREDFYTANEGGTERLLRAAATAAPGAMLVHVSSLAAREPRLSPYCDSKHRAELMVQALAGDRIWTILRPPAVYGPGDREIRPMFQAARLGLVPYPAAPGAALSMIHVADLAEAIAACLTRSGPPQATFEIDDGVPGGYRWPDILSALGEAVGRKPVGAAGAPGRPVPGGAGQPAGVEDRPPGRGSCSPTRSPRSTGRTGSPRGLGCRRCRTGSRPSTSGADSATQRNGTPKLAWFRKLTD